MDRRGPFYFSRLVSTIQDGKKAADLFRYQNPWNGLTNAVARVMSHEMPLLTARLRPPGEEEIEQIRGKYLD